MSPPSDDVVPAVRAADGPTRRGGAQVIPRPESWRPGGPPPWADRAHRPAPGVDVVRARLASAPPPRRSALEDAGVRASAVLAPLYPEGDDVVVVLTRRAQHLRAHRGEVSFPGGGQDPGEELRATALREAWEEIGLDPAIVDIVGQLDHRQTATSRSYIVPFVGVLPGRPELVANPHEVERVLHVPLAELLVDGVYHSERWGLTPLDREMSFFDVEGDTIWGATAAMLRDLLDLLTAE